jgi:hypothetical protein
MRLFLRNIGRNESSEFVEKFIRKMKRLYKKKKENADTIWDYYRFLNQKTIRGMLREEKISKSAVFARNRIGSIDFQEPIQPFIGKTWDHLVGNRHSIEHRGQIYSSVEDSLYSFACLAIILRENSERQIEQYHDFNSKLFEIESV